MARKPLSKKGSVADIKDIGKHWTSLQDAFDKKAVTITGKLKQTLTEFTGENKKPPRDRFPYV